LNEPILGNHPEIGESFESKVGVELIDCFEQER